MRLAAVALVFVMGLAGCSSDPSESTPVPATQSAVAPQTAPPGQQPEQVTSDDLYPDVVSATASRNGDGTWSFSATLSSPYDSPERYADAWRVLAPDGTELGVRVLTHDHAGEQPFTRSLSGVTVPSGVAEVTIQGRDQLSGWGGATVQVTLQPQGMSDNRRVHAMTALRTRAAR